MTFNLKVSNMQQKNYSFGNRSEILKFTRVKLYRRKIFQTPIESCQKEEQMQKLQARFGRAFNNGEKFPSAKKGTTLILLCER